MRLCWIVAFACVLPGCAQTLTDCAQERAALRETGSAIAHAARSDRRAFTARLATRGHATYHCVPGRSGQVRCTSGTPASATTNLEDLYRKHDAAMARVVQACGS